MQHDKRESLARFSPIHARLLRKAVIELGDGYSVYKHTAPNGKVYIGITSRPPEVRWRNGTGYSSSPHFESAIKAYGWENIKHEILMSGLTKEAACQAEKDLIQKYKSADREYGYNQTLGGETGVKFTDEVKAKISEKSKLYYSDPAHREMASNWMRNRTVSNETRKKMSEAAKLRKPVCLSEETRKRIGAKNKETYSSHKWKEENKDKLMAFAQYGYDKAKRVQQVSKDGKVVAEYPSMKAASRATGIRDGNISKCCNGLSKSAGGFIWRCDR